MGEARRRKLMDINYGKPAHQEIRLLREDEPEYANILAVKEGAYPNASSVYLVKSLFGERSFLSAVRCYVRNFKVYADCVSIAKKGDKLTQREIIAIQRFGQELLVAEIEKADVLLVNAGN